jgi:NADH-quinone oxidoreductase subunit L
MFLGCGVGAYAAAIFHLVTHAFFKALLFLGSGSVIHALGGEQDIRKMGGLKAEIPVTALTFLIGTIAIAGLPPLAGFWSKDEILEMAFKGGHQALWLVGMTGAFSPRSTCSVCSTSRSRARPAWRPRWRTTSTNPRRS